MSVSTVKQSQHQIQIPPKVDPRVQRTRTLIKQAFMELLHEKQDFNNITVGEITELAGVNRATFYAHFEDKYALLNYTMRDEFMTTLEKKLSTTVKRSIPEGVRPLMLTVCEFFSGFFGKCPPSVRHTHGAIITMPLQKCIQEVLEAWTVNSNGEHCARAKIAPLMLSWSIYGMALQWSRGEMQMSKEELTDQVLSMMMLEAQS